ncbi:MAG: AraC family transcriptional regulator [Bacteroidetes bacterium]|nr:AraC family transcriptional regulator [Bacteroidota bacterium]
MKSQTAPILSVQNYGLKLSVGSMDWENFRYHTGDTFHINTIEKYVRLSELKEFPIPPHRKEVIDFIFLTKGKVIRTKGLDNYEFTKNQIFFLPAYQITSMTSMTPDAAGFYCHFSSEIFYKKLFRKELLQQFSFMHFTGNPIVEIDDKTAVFVSQLLHRLQDEYKRDEECNLDFVASTLLTIFFAVRPFSRQVPRIIDNAAYRIANEFKGLLIKDVHEKQKVSYYADALSVTPEHLNRCVKSAFGKTAHHYIDDMILLEAKVLLRQSALNVSEVGYKVGKENPGDFIRFFKSKTGITPKQYRNEV